jgi:hypothetical protein
MSIKYVLKQPGPVGAGLLPVQSGQGWSASVGAGAADRPQETLHTKNCLILIIIYNQQIYLT